MESPIKDMLIPDIYISNMTTHDANLRYLHMSYDHNLDQNYKW